MLARRRAERDALLAGARAYVAEVARALPFLRAAVVIGSVARGDFNRWSDVDLLLVADELPAGFLERHDLLPPRPGGIQPILWTPAEWEDQAARGNPMTVEADACGVWMVGSAGSVPGG